MTLGRPPSDARDRALDAALAITTRDGVTALTIDAVAREAGISKGGVLHHFRTKDALVLAMVEKLIVAFEAAAQALSDSDDKPVGRYTRAFYTAVTSPPLAVAGRALLAAVAMNPALLEPLRASFNRCYARLESDGIDPVDAHLCALAADAIWMRAIFELPPMPPEIEAAIHERLRLTTTTKARKR